MATNPAAPPAASADPPPAARTTEPAKPATEPAKSAETPEAAPEWRNWLYTGRDRIYTNIPVTVTTGDIVHWHSNPGGEHDSCWTATTDKANKLPDNYRPEPTEAEAARLRGDDTPEEG